MKLIFSATLCATVLVAVAQKPKKFNDTTYLQPIEINALRAGEKAPFTKTNLTKKDIERNNLGQDLPFLLNQTPGVVINSDAGAGVGYTGIRIRGTDASRINVTINGIPYNDAESQGTFFVNMPDFASSINSIQIQRGVGTSSNGAAAFGATLNLSTNEINKGSYLALNNAAGSFNTFKNTLQFGSGLIKKHFTFDGRFSRITSDGYVDRATSNLQSFYVSGAYINDKHSLRFNIFSGKEKTYQAWNGVSEALIKSNRTYNQSGTEKTDDPYDNETDNYAQTHYQLFFNSKLNAYWKSNVTVFLTRGRGYYEQYKADRKLSSFGLPDYVNGTTTIKRTDVVRQLWLDNYFYGTTFSAQCNKYKTAVAIGGGINQYNGKHYGIIKWAAVQAAVPTNYKWYNLPAVKKDFSLYTKLTQQLHTHLYSFVDIQFRNVNYSINGFRDNPSIKVRSNYNFINPKVGFTLIKNSWKAYASYALAQKEPNRDDFEAGATQKPTAEVLHDFEGGIEHKNNAYSFAATFYYMKYKNQLVLTGKINDVGAYTRTNQPNSYRSGLELQGGYVFSTKINVTANAVFSTNKIKKFTEYIDNYDNGTQQLNMYNKTDIAFSPNTILSSSINIAPIRNAEINLVSKYVSRQYLDNTAQKKRRLNPFYTQDVRLSYSLRGKVLKQTDFILQINNGVFNTETFLFPMAPINFMAGINISF
jgi:iron complex outermembrane recepter protein